MKTFLLVIVLTLVSGTEQHVAIIMPDEETCEALRDAYVHAVEIQLGDIPANDVRLSINVDEVRCEQGES